MTAQKLLGWSKSGAKGSWLFVSILVGMLWFIVVAFFKLAYALIQWLPDDAFETESSEYEEENSFVVNKGDFPGHSHRYETLGGKELIIDD